MRAAAVAAIALLAAGCGSSPEASSDCARQLRYDDRTYTEAGFSSRDVTSVGTAEVASCDDTGKDPEGNVFDGSGKKVEVGAFDGFDPATVLGGEVIEGTTVVYVVDGISEEDLAAVQLALTDAGQQ